MHAGKQLGPGGLPSKLLTVQPKPLAGNSEASRARVSPAHDYLRQIRRHPLDPLLAPKVVALIGATEKPDSVGCALMKNLLGFEGVVYPINPKHRSVFGVQALPKIGLVPEKVDLAAIVTPAPTVPELVQECAQAGIPGVMIISAGFKECGTEGAKLEQELLSIARASKMRILGPNCLGIMMPHAGFNATFASSLAKPGTVGFLSQSGALCTAVLDWSLHENVGFSAFISVGSMVDVGWGDLIYYLGDDPQTKSIVIYMESVGDARSFLSAAREVSLTKPIIVLKVGKTEGAAKAAASHTGALTGSDDVLHAAFRRVGVLRVNTVEELFDMAEVLGKQPRPRGPRLGIVTNAGGPGVLAADMLLTSGGQLAELSPETLNALNQVLPGPWSHNDPIDILGDAGPDRYAKAMEIVAKDPNIDGLLAILTPQAMTDPTGTAEQLKLFAKFPGKPFLASWMGAHEIEVGEEILNRAGIPTFRYPDCAARAFYYMWRYSYNLRSLYETPAALPACEDSSVRHDRAEKLIQRARKLGRTLLTEFESKKLLEAYEIPTVVTRLALTEERAVQCAEQIGYPVVLKLHSETITHKMDVGGVQLNLRNATAVRRAWKAIETSVGETAGPQHFLGVTVQPMIMHPGFELIIGSSIDPQFGPVLLFGPGGHLVEVFRDRALALPPLNGTLARRMMEQTNIYGALKGVRGRKSVDLAALEQLLVRFSQLITEQPWIAEMDINPLLAAPEGLLALDARVVLHGKEVNEGKLPRPAIRPYPSQYVTHWKLENGTPVTLRPIRPEDEPLMVKFHETLSEQSVYYRYFSFLKLPQRIAHERLTRICFNDYDREIALVADHQDAKTGAHQILGIGRLSKIHGANEAEFALLLGDPWQKLGLGTELLKLLVECGRNEKLDRILAHILAENHAMQHVCRKAGFQIHFDAGEGECTAQYLFT